MAYYGERRSYQYANDKSFQLVQKSLSCTGVMTTTAAIEIKDANEAKRSSRKFVERKRLSLGRDKLGDEIRKLRASVSENEDL